jgi:MscS family membrane protein
MDQEDILGQLANIPSNLMDQLSLWVGRLDVEALSVVSILLILVFLARKTLANLAVNSVRYIAEKIQIGLDETIKDALLPAAQALIISLPVYGLVTVLNLPTLLDQTLERLVVSVAIASIFSAGYSLVDVTVAWIVAPKDRVKGLQLYWIKKVLRAVVVVLGITAVLAVWEIDLGPVLTGMGVMGAGIALAAQDLFRNLIAGMTSLGEKRFDIGEWVRVEGVVEGTVEKMELRSTLIRRFDQAAVHVPNAELSNTTLINFTRRPYRRVRWSVQLVYGTTAAQLKKVRDEIEKFIDDSEDFAPPELAARYVRIESYSESSIDILINCFTNTIDYGKYLEAKERLVLSVKQIVEDAEASFAFPTRSVIVERTQESEVEE